MTSVSKKLWHCVWRPPWRVFTVLILLAGMVVISYWIWIPGTQIIDGRHNLNLNGIWIQHGWLGDDAWFERNSRDKSRFRSMEHVNQLAEQLTENGIKYLYPHLCPCEHNGHIAAVDFDQTERFLDSIGDINVLPWIGGVLDVHCFPAIPGWRQRFITSTLELLEAHPRLAGVHINIEPMPSGNPHFLTLLEELRATMPDGKVLSLAAYPPPSLWHPMKEVHWDESYYRQVSAHSNQLAVMMYDTAIRFPKIYQNLMVEWTREVLSWAPDSNVLLGVPAYDDMGVGYHHPEVENLENSILGIHTGLSKFEMLPANYQGIALYCEWEMDSSEWEYFGEEFVHPK